MVVDRDDALIIDVKTGREQPWHAVQVIIYQYALPKALPQYRNARLASEILYLTRTVQVPRGNLDNGFIQALGALIRRLTAERPALRVPSAQECRYCDITAADCAERVHEGSERDGGTTHDF